MPSAKVEKVLWWLCLFVAPIVLIAIELFHPAGFTIWWSSRQGAHA